MKKIFSIITVLTVAAMIIPQSAQSITADELQVQINALLASLSALQTQLATLQGTTPTVTGCTITSFDRSLKQGMSGDDVKCLQIVLNSSADTQVAASGVGSSGKETTYYGFLTTAAVKKFQAKYGTGSLGTVGPNTRAKLNAMMKPYFSIPNIINKILSWGHHSPSTPRSIDTIIVHSSYDALGNDPYSVNGVIKEYEIYSVSPHYLIARDGAIYRLAPDEDIAYHAGTSKMPDGRSNVNNFSIGIELINKKSEGPNEIQYNSLVNLVKFLKSKYKINYILGHNQIAPTRKTDPWNFDWQKFSEKLNK